MTNVICFINQKGGVGKTTSSVNTAAILAERNNRVLLIDLDPQANSTGYFDMYDSDQPNIYDVMVKGAKVESAIRNVDNIPGLSLLPSVLNFSRAELELAQKLMRQEYILKDALSSVIEDYDYVIMDCPPARNKITINALTASDYVVLPTIPDHFAIESIISMSDLLEMVQKGVNPVLKVLGILLTLDERTKNKQAYKQALQSGELLPCFEVTIRKNTKLQEAINSHMPINIYDTGSTGNKDYQKFVDELVSRVGH